jgi:tetratricopeptide (TPR) repeat protein
LARKSSRRSATRGSWPFPALRLRRRATRPAVQLAAAGARAPLPPGPQQDALIKEALRAADTAIRLDRANSEALSHKSYLIDARDLVGREALLKQALAARPLACGCEHHFYGNFLMEVGRVNDAVAEYRRAVDIMPLNGSSQVSLAEALIAAGKPEQSKRHFDAAVDLVDRPTMKDEIAIMTAPLTGNYPVNHETLNNPDIAVPAPVRSAVTASFER